MKKLLVFLFVFFFFSTQAYAQRGCCSWHGGVSGCDSSVGRQVCNDGTYSPSCTCTVAPPPPPAVSALPKTPDLKANFTYEPNLETKKYNMNMNWNHIDNTGFSLAVSDYPGVDPGPSTDTLSDSFTFYRVSPGVHYVNMKMGINRIWSPIFYWKIDVPELNPNDYINTPTPIPFSSNKVSNNDSSIKRFIKWIYGIFENS